MKKIEKLREVNAVIGEKLMELETLMFMEKMHEVAKTPIKTIYNKD